MPPHESTPLLAPQGAQGDQFQPLKASRWIIFNSWINVLLVAVPLSLLAEHLKWSAVARFTTSFIAIVPLAKLLGDATEQLAMKMGQTTGGLLNATFGNAVELIVAVAALLQDQPDLVKTSLLGSVLSNLLLVLGMSFLASGFYFYESTFQVTAAQATSSLLTLSCITLIIPAAYHASKSDDEISPWLTSAVAESEPSSSMLALSRGTALMMLGAYCAYLLFQLHTHAGLFEAEVEEEETPDMDKYSAGLWLLGVTVVTAFCADILVGSIDETAEQWHLPRRFIGLILLPLVGNAAEHVTSVWMACKGKMELTIGVAVGSSIQIAAGMIPVLVLIAWPLQRPLTLLFHNFDTIVMFVSVLLVNLLLQDGRTNWLEGLMLIVLYFVIALSYYVA